MFLAFVKLLENAEAEAVVWLRRSLEANRNNALAHFILAATLALLGKLDEARAAAHAGLALNPMFTVRRFRLDAVVDDDPTYLAKRERICQGMHMAGVPEG
jgi:tetratricopeptide (TPR) repeat protein